MKKVMVVPIDNRPVQMYTLRQAGLAAGLELVFPPESYIETLLDQNSSGTGFKFGSQDNLKNWILANKDSVDGFIISADQLHSGGLVGSRALPHSILLANAKTYLDVLKQLPTNKPRYVFDTVMRLASTIGVQGLTLNNYNAIRAWAQKERWSYYTVSEITSNYQKLSNGSLVWDLDATTMSRYITARSRKFQLNEHLIQLGEQGAFDYLTIGVDDAYSTGVQINEINWLKARMHWGLGQTAVEGEAIFSGADDLAHILLARMARTLHGGNAIKATISYFGSENAATRIAPYETEPMAKTLEKHMTVAGVTKVTSSPDVDIICAMPTLSAAQITSIVTKIQNNENAGIRSIVIDGTDHRANTALATSLIQQAAQSRLMSYSAWNTWGNRTGIAVGAGVARLIWLKNNGSATTTDKNNATIAQARSLYRAFLKDYFYNSVYCPSDYIKGYINGTAYADGTFPVNAARHENFAKAGMTTTQWNKARSQLTYIMTTQETNNLFPYFSGKSVVHSLVSGTTLKNISTTRGSTTYDFPWGRIFECDIEPQVTIL